MSEPYTDKYGYPLTAVEIARRLTRPTSAGFYRNGRWIKRKPKEPASDRLPTSRPADDRHA